MPTWNPEDRQQIGGADSRHGTQGLAADVRYYGRRIGGSARAKLGDFYPKVRLPKERGGQGANVIAWIWARTVASPDPAAQAKHVPLISTYWLSNKKGGETWLEPVVDKAKGNYRFEVRTGAPANRSLSPWEPKMAEGDFVVCSPMYPSPLITYELRGRTAGSAS